VRDDKTDTNWLLLDYESDKSDKLRLTKTGTGGLQELQEQLDEGKASFGYVRVTFANDEQSKREKFALIVGVLLGCS
jgi:Cofilin/tropomyosin-type actin-binding protein